MYDVTYSLNGIIKHISINAQNENEVFNIITNMYGNGTIQIINIRRI